MPFKNVSVIAVHLFVLFQFDTRFKHIESVCLENLHTSGNLFIFNTLQGRNDYISGYEKPSKNCLCFCILVFIPIWKLDSVHETEVP
jgi:hypothetical protein